MLLFVAHENFNNDILRGAWRRNPGIDIVRVQVSGYPVPMTQRSSNGRRNATVSS